MGRKQNQSAEGLWRDRLSRFRKSNLTVREFCRQEGVSDPSFYQWRKRLWPGGRSAKQVGRSRDPQAAKPQPFVPVMVSASVLAELEFPNGVRIRVPATNGEALRLAIQAGKELLREAS
jgi:transposase-like protein